MAAAAVATEFDCQKIIDKIHKQGYEIVGLEKLTKELGVKLKASPPLIKLSLKRDGSDIVYAIIMVEADYPDNSKPCIFIDEIQRNSFSHNQSAKGTGRLLLDLILCQAVSRGFNLHLKAKPGVFLKGANESMQRKLFTFYETSGLNMNGNENKTYSGLVRPYKTLNHNKIKRTMKNTYTGGKRSKTHRHR